jgi:hypothetical protein
MQQTRPGYDTISAPVRPGLAVAAILALLLAAPAMAQQKGQQTFASAEAASGALVKAAQESDDRELARILGPDGRQIAASGDAAEDARHRANFIEKYQEMHRLVQEPDGTTVLYIGARNWPAPIPIVNHGKGWYFDTRAGRKEILFRRIGQNEYSTIRVCLELVAAQREYHSNHERQYARFILSDAGQRNGLFWQAADGEVQSPMGPLVAGAEFRNGGDGRIGSPAPYRGYFYRVLVRQGKNAPGGARIYTENEAMTRGFAFLAFPAKYRSSGVLTFMVGEDGIVYEKDLGPETRVRAEAMPGYNPTRTWSVAEWEPEPTP